MGGAALGGWMTGLFRPGHAAALLLGALGAVLAASCVSALPDLRVSVEPAAVGVDGQMVPVTVNVTNAGDAPSGNFTTNVSVDGVAQPDVDFGSIAAGGSASLVSDITWVCGHHNITARADSLGV